MPLPNSYTIKSGSIPAYLDAISNAQPPDRFSIKFLENLGFTSTNDRLFVGVLRDLGFLNSDGAPQPRYYQYLDKAQSARVLAEGIREAFSDLFAVNKSAHELNIDQAKSKLRSLYVGKKTDLVIGHIAKTFKTLCDQADFSAPQAQVQFVEAEKKQELPGNSAPDATQQSEHPAPSSAARLKVHGLQYHINIVLPETRDQGVYDAIFKSLRDHLG